MERIWGGDGEDMEKRMGREAEGILVPGTPRDA
jgi:hypothetical protein